MSVSPYLPTILAAISSLPAALTAQEPPQREPATRPGATPAVAKATLFDGNGHVIGARHSGGAAGGKFGGRRDGRRRLGGRMPAVAATIGSGLLWLQKHQDDDGAFDAARFMRHDKTGTKCDGPGEGLGRVGTTAFCLLPFLGDGHTLAHGRFRAVVVKGVGWLRRQQHESGAYSLRTLEHALASYAICEAAGLSASRVLAAEARAALRHLATLQNANGGFHFAGKGDRSDAFTTVHALFAYKSGIDFRFVTEREPLTQGERWLVTAEDPRAARAPIAHGARSRETAVAARLLAGFFLGQHPNQVPAMRAAAETIRAHHPTTDKRAADPVFYYLTTYGLYQMGDLYWDKWSRALITMITETQRDDSNFAGSWDPVGPGTALGGRLYATALSVLMAESYFRYTRLVR